MTNALGMASALLFPCALGSAVLLLILGRPLKSGLMTASVGLGLGLGIITQWMMILLVMRCPLNPWTIDLPLCGILALLAALLRPWNKNLTAPPNAERPASMSLVKSLVFMAAVGYMAYQIYFAFVNALIFPVFTPDGLHSVALKAKYFYDNGPLEDLNSLVSPSYPLHVELSMAWIALNLHAWDDQAVKIVFPLIFTCCLIIECGFLEYFTDRMWAAIGGALLCSSNFFNYHATIEYRALFLAFYALVPLLMLILWDRERNDGYLLLGGLFAGFAAFTKLEATGYVLVYAAILWIILQRTNAGHGRKLVASVRFFLPVVVIVIFFLTIKKMFGVSLAEGLLGMPGHIDYPARALDMTAKLAENLFLTNNWNILWFILLVSLTFHAGRIKECFVIQILLAALVLFLGLYFCAGLWTVSYEKLYDPLNLSRAILHFFPLVPLLIVFLNSGKALQVDGSKTTSTQ